MFVLGQQALIEYNQHRLVFGTGFAEEFFHRGVVVFLLSQDGDQDISTTSHGVRPHPVDPSVAVNIRRVQNQQRGRQIRRCLPIQIMVVRFFQGGAGGRPFMQSEIRKYGLQIMSITKARWNQTYGMFCAGRQRAGRAGPRARKVVERDTLADVCATDDGRHQPRIFAKLRHQLLPQQFVPLLTIKGNWLQKLRLDLKCLHDIVQTPSCGGDVLEAG